MPLQKLSDATGSRFYERDPLAKHLARSFGITPQRQAARRRDEAQAKRIQKMLANCDSTDQLLKKLRQDADVSGSFFKRQFEYRIPQIFEEKRPIPTGIQDVPTNTGISDLDEEVYEERMYEFGAAGPVAPEGDYFPTVNVSYNEFPFPIYTFGIGVEYSDREIRKAEAANRPVKANKMRAARRILDEKIDRLCYYGDARFNSTDSPFTGLLNDPNVTTVDTAIDFYDDNTDPIVMAKFWLRQIHRINEETELVEEPNKMNWPPALLNEQAETPIGDNADKTVLNYIKTNQESAVRHFKRNRAKARYLEENEVFVPGTGKDRIVIYPQNRGILQRFTTGIMNTGVYRKSATRYVIGMYFRTTGVITHYPGALRYIDVNVPS